MVSREEGSFRTDFLKNCQTIHSVCVNNIKWTIVVYFILPVLHLSLRSQSTVNLTILINNRNNNIYSAIIQIWKPKNLLINLYGQMLSQSLIHTGRIVIRRMIVRTKEVRAERSLAIIIVNIVDYLVINIIYVVEY